MNETDKIPVENPPVPNNTNRGEAMKGQLTLNVLGLLELISEQKKQLDHAIQHDYYKVLSVEYSFEGVKVHLNWSLALDMLWNNKFVLVDVTELSSCNLHLTCRYSPLDIKVVCCIDREELEDYLRSNHREDLIHSYMTTYREFMNMVFTVDFRTIDREDM